jgi:type I restriction enzyme S subunit
MGERELPAGWEWKRLGEAANINMGQSPSGTSYNENGNGTPFLQGNAEFGDTFPKHKKFTTEPSKIASKSSVLISVRAPVGDTNIADLNYCIGRGLASISLKNGDNKYLLYLLRSMKPMIEAKGTGSTFKAISKSILYDIEIPLPPLPIQRDIVAVLEKAEAVKRQRQEADALTGALLQSVFQEMFGDPERNEREWEKVKLGSIITKIDSGPSKKLNVAGKGFINITSGEIQKGLFLVFKNLKYLDVPEDLTRYFLEKDDLIINYVNSLSEIGKSALYRGEFSPVVVGHNVFRVRIDHSQVDPIFLVSIFKTQYFRNQIKTITKPAVNQASFSTKDLKKCEVLLPPLALQQQFARIVQDVERIRDQQGVSGRHIEGLCEGLMQRAFAGELGTLEV